MLNPNNEYTKEEQKAHRKEWIDALRSGKYKQGIGKLCSITDNEKFYCCLGVACEVAGAPSREHHTSCDDETICLIYDDYDSSFISPRIQEYYGLRDKYGFLELNGMDSSLIEINDCGSFFDEIANIMEEHENELFYV